MLDEERLKKAISKLARNDPQMHIAVGIADEDFTVDPNEFLVIALLLSIGKALRKK